MGTFIDTSVVTEATGPSLFEFVTEARLSTKKGKVVEWTLVHRYEIASRARAAPSRTRCARSASASCPGL